MEIWLVRHGETFANTQKIIQGQQGGELTEKGIEQAKLVGQRLSKESFHKIYCSDLNRTVQTASQITCYHTTTEIILEPRLREKSGGVLEGLPLAQFKKDADKAKKGIREYKPAKGENWQDVMNRAKSLIDELASMHLQTQETQPATIKKTQKEKLYEEEEKQGPSTLIENQQKSMNKLLLVTHGGFIMEFMNVVRTLQGKQALFNNCTKNTAIYVIRFSTKEVKTKKGTVKKLVPQVLVENDNSHLSQFKTADS